MEKILISAGVVLSLGGVWLMIRASIYEDQKTEKNGLIAMILYNGW